MNTARRAYGESLIRGVCIIEGCSRPQANHGLNPKGRKTYKKFCDKHHRIKFDIENGFILKNIANKKCEACGWDKGPCDRDRKIPELGYVPGNVNILCPNCHRLKSMGILKI